MADFQTYEKQRKASNARPEQAQSISERWKFAFASLILPR